MDSKDIVRLLAAGVRIAAASFVNASLASLSAR